MSASTSSMSKCTSTISYRKVYQNWLSADEKLNNGESAIFLDPILEKMQTRQLLNQNEVDIVEHKITGKSKRQKLFVDIMPAKGESGLKQVAEILNENNNNDLANNLQEQEQKCLSEFRETSILDTNGHSVDTLYKRRPSIMRSVISFFLFQRKEVKEAQRHISRIIIENVDLMANWWSGVIRVSRTDDAFVDVQIVENVKSESGAHIRQYEDIFLKGKTTFRRILFQGDPGCGKTTYVTKLALDWANGNKYLRKKFDFVFYIGLKTLQTSLDGAIRIQLPENSVSFIENYFKHPSSKVLLILDGFDELQCDSEMYASVKCILDGRCSAYTFFTVIVTTRSSHLDKIPNRFRERCLLIKGFDENSTKLFLKRQNVQFPLVEESNLRFLLQNPLFCSIYCSLNIGGGKSVRLEDSYDFMKGLVDNCVEHAKLTKGLANEHAEEQLLTLGIAAFRVLDDPTTTAFKSFLSFLDILFQPQLSNEKHLIFQRKLAEVDLGLLIKKKIPTAGFNKFEEEMSFPHQLIADYLAARLLARALTDEQLQQVYPSALVNLMTYSKQKLPIITKSLPSVQFFLFELLTRFEKPFNNRLLVKFLEVPEIRFIWSYKSTVNVPNVGDINALQFLGFGKEMLNHSRFFPTLATCSNLSSLTFSSCSMTSQQVVALVELFNGNYLETFATSVKTPFSDHRRVCSVQ